MSLIERAPRRIQLRRTKGWRIPPRTVKVDRTTRYGNPFRLDGYWDAGGSGGTYAAALSCVAAYRAWLLGEPHWLHRDALPPVPDLEPLRGRNLACWCGFEREPCHADVLLELANLPRLPVT